MKEYFEKQLNKLIGVDTDKDIDIQIDQYPRFLYKYRSCQERSFKMIETQELWAAEPNTFYDPQDSLVRLIEFEKDYELQQMIFKHIGEIVYYNIPPKGMKKSKNGQTLKNYRDKQEMFFDKKGKYSAKKAQRAMITEIKKLPHKQQLEVKKAFKEVESEIYKNKLLEVIEDANDKIRNLFRNNVYICCLTKRNDNQKMWEDYAKCYSGFVIEYDLFKYDGSAEITSIISKLFPVKYYKRMPKVSIVSFVEAAFQKKFYNKAVNIDEDNRKLYEQLFIKKSEYQSEEEWRIISEEHEIHFPVISAVYMGYKIKKRNENRLTKICSKCKISLYKQSIDPIEKEPKFKQILKDGIKI